MRGRFTPTPTGMPEPVVLTTMSMQCMGGMLIANQRATSGTSTAWSVANTPFFYPFTITTPRTYVGMIWMNGAAVSGNVNAAIYSADGVTSLGVIGTVAQSGTTVTQQKAFGSPLTLAPGTYFMALVLDNTTGTIVGASMTAAVVRAAGARQLASFFALTATAAAWVGITNSRVPVFGLYEASWL
jgi:hypothetical protein